MSQLQRLCIQLYTDEEGQATVEYVLILIFTVGFASQLSKLLLGALDRAILVLGAELERGLKTGRLKPNVWQN
jgi:hypothetical protein